jgi:Ni,Fe-hydrogenase I large subunit
MALVSDPNEDVRHDSDELLDAVAALRRLEEEKRRSPISSPRFHELAEEVTAKARAIMYGAQDEERVGNRTKRTSVSIDDEAAGGPGEDDDSRD